MNSLSAGQRGLPASQVRLARLEVGVEQRNMSKPDITGGTRHSLIISHHNIRTWIPSQMILFKCYKRCRLWYKSLSWWKYIKFYWYFLSPWTVEPCVFCVDPALNFLSRPNLSGIIPHVCLVASPLSAHHQYLSTSRLCQPAPARYNLFSEQLANHWLELYTNTLYTMLHWLHRNS